MENYLQRLDIEQGVLYPSTRKYQADQYGYEKYAFWGFLTLLQKIFKWSSAIIIWHLSINFTNEGSKAFMQNYSLRCLDHF